MVDKHKILDAFCMIVVFYSYLCKQNTYSNMANRELNRLKVVLAEKKKTNKWLGEQLGKDKTTISKWCINTCQPDLGSLMKISRLLEVEVVDLLREDNID